MGGACLQVAHGRVVGGATTLVCVDRALGWGARSHRIVYGAHWAGAGAPIVLVMGKVVVLRWTLPQRAARGKVVVLHEHVGVRHVGGLGVGDGRRGAVGVGTPWGRRRVTRGVAGWGGVGVGGHSLGGVGVRGSRLHHGLLVISELEGDLHHAGWQGEDGVTHHLGHVLLLSRCHYHLGW